MTLEKYRSGIRLEALIALAAGLLFGALAIHFDLFEKTYAFTRHHEAWQLDELFCVAFTLLTALAVLSLRYIFVLRRMTRELREANDIIHKHNEVQNQKERLAALGQMASGLAHEISNSLQPTIGLGGFIRDSLREQGKVRHSAFIDVMMSSAKHAQQIIDNVLAFAQSRPLVLEEMSAPDALRNAIDFATDRLAGSTSVRLEGLDTLTHANGTPLRMKASPTALAQIFVNLLKNAAMAMKHEGRILIETFPSCLIEEGTKHEAISVSVTDTGCGIDETAIQHVFDPFFSTKDASEGAGLGLPVVYGLVKQHGGTLSVSSEKDKGTTFTLVFPILPFE